MMYKLEYNTTSTLDLKPGKYFNNKTRYYLIPTLYGFGKDFSPHWNCLTKLGVGIYDYNYSTEEDNNLYFLFDLNGTSSYGMYDDEAGSKIKFLDSLTYFKSLDEYVTNYSYSSNRHMVVMSIPSMFGDIKDKFIKGKYSELYSTERLETIIKKTYNDSDIEKLSAPFAVMKQTRAQILKFKQQVLTDFNVELEDNDILTEYEYPPNLSEEIFNYRELQ